MQNSIVSMQDRFNNASFKIRVVVGVYDIEDVDEPVSNMCDKAFIASETIKNNYEANIYSIASPVLPIQNMTVQESKGTWWKLLFICICVAGLGGIGWRLRNSRKHDKKEVISISQQDICEKEEGGRF